MEQDPGTTPRTNTASRSFAEIDLARESGSQLLLYPHTGNWIQRIEEAVHRRQSGSAQRRCDVQSLPLAARGQVARLQTAAPASHAATLGCLHQRRRRVRRQTRLEPLYPTARRRQLRCRDVLESVRPRLQRPGRAAVLRHRRRRPRTPSPAPWPHGAKCRGPCKLPRT